jgi:hypothetical protein
MQYPVHAGSDTRMTFSRLVRRTHMYLALFLAPWMVLYALSTVVMSHGWVAPVAFELERVQPYAASFAPDTPARAIGEQILSDLDLAGAFGVQGPSPEGRLTINRNDMVTPRRIIYTLGSHELRIERAAFRTNAFLSRFHHRRSYAQPFAADDAFAVGIDAVIVGMTFWALSGLWMWWEMRATRLWGVACGLAGVGLFVVLLVTI